ncbi:MAG: bifunctional transaldolase/phosoglucose isomerase [Acidobacteriia bacterium]|nr:bifunctional transaldolase/phosoglucose isomerase [Terriglobia bacterium]
MTSAAIEKEFPINPLKALLSYGQSVWLDFIRRSLITSGELGRLVEEDGLRGVTSNPAIFEKAIVGSTDYRDILSATRFRDLDAKALYEEIAVRDIRDAADVLRAIYDSSKARDGYVSLEVSPTLAHDTEGTLDEARRLWKTVGRPNLLIKVPATAEGIPAIRQLIGEAINVNVTLLFAQSVYERVAEAFIAGLEERQAGGQDVRNIASVASFFISRIDTAVDALLSAEIKTSTDAGQRARLTGLLGKTAIANAKITYQRACEIYSSQRWKRLAERGAQSQRLLWASTSTKNPSYRDVIYVEELIGADTVNTIPPATFNGFRDHGNLRKSLTEDLEGAFATMEALGKVGISMKEVTGKLLVEGVQQFATAFDQLLKSTGRRLETHESVKINRQTYKMPQDLAAAVQATLDDWKTREKARRLWRGDASLWTGADEANWLGWMGISDDQLAHLQHLQGIAEEVRTAGFKHALLLGMGGSSLCPEVMRRTFGKIAGSPELHVLDSTDPAQIKTIESRIDYQSTVFIVSSKSGGTLEPNIFKQYFFERAQRELGAAEAGNRFIAITDPGSIMQHVAESDRFRHIFYGLKSIGGRYSALSDFGMVPAAIMGVDLPRFLNATEEMVHACGATVPVEENPGIVLGAILGTLGVGGRDKVTIVTSPGIFDLGAWLEQLLAESTGKIGKGLIPVDRERLGKPEVYGDDRVFAYLRLDSEPDKSQDAAVAALEEAGQPVVRIAVQHQYSLGEEFFRWEIATAVAGSVIGINPFNQPDVEASKVKTRELMNAPTGSARNETPVFKSNGISIFAAARAASARSGANSLSSVLNQFFASARPGDYCAILTYLNPTKNVTEMVQEIRRAILDRKHIATCAGIGPRFLHSTGQAYKGGPNTGMFLQITSDHEPDLEVPEHSYSFGKVIDATARGDFEVLIERGRRALRVHLEQDTETGLRKLERAISEALG